MSAETPFQREENLIDIFVQTDTHLLYPKSLTTLNPKKKCLVVPGTDAKLMMSAVGSRVVVSSPHSAMARDTG